jgi:hypothetical protein
MRIIELFNKIYFQRLLHKIKISYLIKIKISYWIKIKTMHWIKIKIISLFILFIFCRNPKATILGLFVLVIKIKLTNQ